MSSRRVSSRSAQGAEDSATEPTLARLSQTSQDRRPAEVLGVPAVASEAPVLVLEDHQVEEDLEVVVDAVQRMSNNAPLLTSSNVQL